ncbi:MAG: carboxypeptidase-like regulatory domain-containing protein, partial [Terriglobia bacterium]
MALVLVSALLIAGWAWGQTVAGSITGRVEDSSGGVIPNAKVTLTQVATGQTRAVTTNARGEFVAPLMPIGAYEVAARYQGFKTELRSGIILHVDETVSLRMILQPGSTRQSVQVVSAAPLLETRTYSLGQVILNNQVLNMPLNGRNIFQLGLLTGYTTPVSGMGTNQTFAGGGGRFSGNNILLDGISDNTTATNGSIGRNGYLYTPSVDAVQEFKVTTSDFSAEFGHAAGSLVSVAIKAGTNHFHGDLFEFLRNNAFDANNFFSNSANQPISPFRRSQFGGTLG